MKKLCVLLLFAAPLALQFCSSSKNATKDIPMISYTTNVQPLILANCSPCHIPPKGRIKALDTYASAMSNIDSIITRVNKNPNEKGFMPFKHPKLADSTINVLVQWKKDGLREN
ncbi:MAG: hypothetical protein ABIW34_02470 [Ginsengibacter sp.]